MLGGFVKITRRREGEVNRGQVFTRAGRSEHQ